MNDQEKWDRVFLEMADAIAKKSKDPSTQVGAILVSPDQRHISGGYNGFPSRIPDDPHVLHKEWDFILGEAGLNGLNDRLRNNVVSLGFSDDKTFALPRVGNKQLAAADIALTKYDCMIHAEQNAILNCHVRPQDWTIYVTHQPCILCAKFIIGAGIKRAVFYNAETNGRTQDWGFSKSTQLLEYCLEVSRYERID